MYYQMFPRMSMETGESLASPAINVDGQSVLVGGLTTYTLSGTSPSISVNIQTSNDGEIWSSVGTIVTGTTVGLALGNFQITSNEWARLVRVQVIISGGNAVAEFSVGLQTLRST